MQIRFLKARADNPLASLEGAAAIAAQTFGFRLLDTSAQGAQIQNFEDVIEEVDGRPQRETVWVFDDTITVQILGETWTLESFVRSFMDLAWCDQHAESPVANLRHYHENLTRYRDHFRAHRPMIRLRHGKRTLTIRADATEEEKSKWLKLL